jgi:hypothetical protein
MDKCLETPAKKLAAACGLFCPACTLYIATKEEPARLAQLSRLFGIAEEEIKCFGCHSEKRGPYCQTCVMIRCSEEKGLDFCGQCDEYPCDDLKSFQAEAPHRIELWDDLERIHEVGYDAWFKEKIAHYSCPQCQTINSAYDLQCRSCGNEPSCKYVRLHKSAILPFLRKFE